MKDKLKITYNITIEAKYAGLIPVVASAKGWNGQGDPKEYLGIVCSGEINTYMKGVIESSLIRYFGLSQKDLINQASIDYDTGANILAEWSQIEDD